jgi:hypothetical protein
VKKVLDWRGNEIGVGSWIVYASTQSSSITMHEGIVRKITWREDKPDLHVEKQGTHHDARLKSRGFEPRPAGKLSRVSAVDRVVVVLPRGNRIYPPGKSYEENVDTIQQELDAILETHSDFMAEAG